jgi:hypothetical protein
MALMAAHGEIAPNRRLASVLSKGARFISIHAIRAEIV